MSRSTLKYLRLLLPGVITLLCFMPLFNITLGQQVASTVSEYFKFLTDILSEDIVKLLVVIVFGSVYYALDLRGPIIRDSLGMIQSNIKARLLEQHAGDHVVAPNLNALRQDRRLIDDVFYHFVDKDESLKAKAELVYFNGLFWTTFADVHGIAMFASLAYLIAFFITNIKVLVVWAFVLGVISVLSRYAFLPKIVKRHINLSNDQLEYILQHYSDELLTELRKLAQSQAAHA